MTVHRITSSDTTGKPLEAFPRNKGREEFRVSLDEFNGRPFFSLRIEERDDSGTWWPTREEVGDRLT
jgi:hypothetical protein